MRYTEISEDLKDKTIKQLIELIIALTNDKAIAVHELADVKRIPCAILDKYFPGWEVYMPDEDEGGDE